jgi:hypothetical protein
LALSSVFCVSVPTAHVPAVMVEETVLGGVTGLLGLVASLAPPHAARERMAVSTTKGVPDVLRMG